MRVTRDDSEDIGQDLAIAMAPEVVEQHERALDFEERRHVGREILVTVQQEANVIDDAKFELFT